MAGPIYIDAEVIPVRNQGLPWPLRRSEDTSAFSRTDLAAKLTSLRRNGFVEVISCLKRVMGPASQ